MRSLFALLAVNRLFFSYAIGFFYYKFHFTNFYLSHFLFPLPHPFQLLFFTESTRAYVTRQWVTNAIKPLSSGDLPIGGNMVTTYICKVNVSQSEFVGWTYDGYNGCRIAVNQQTQVVTDGEITYLEDDGSYQWLWSFYFMFEQRSTENLVVIDDGKKAIASNDMGYQGLAGSTENTFVSNFGQNGGYNQMIWFADINDGSAYPSFYEYRILTYVPPCQPGFTGSGGSSCSFCARMFFFSFSFFASVELLVEEAFLIRYIFFSLFFPNSRYL